MSDIDNRLVAVPGVMELGGRDYLVSPPSDGDIFMLMQYVTKVAKKAYSPVKEAVEMCKGLDISKEAKDTIILEAYRSGNSKEVPAERINEVMMSPIGCRFFAFLLCKKEQSEIKMDHFKEIITEDNWVEVFSQLDTASGMDFIHSGIEASGFFRRGSSGRALDSPVVQNEDKEGSLS